MHEFYQIRHIRENREISARSFRESQMDYAYQWRDDNGSIPWAMFRIESDYPSGPVIQECQIDPWTGNPL